jgi:hypothetical protein
VSFSAVLVLLIAVILTSWNAAPPPVRKIPPNGVSNLKHEEDLRNARWSAEQAINAAENNLGAPDASISDFFRHDTMALIEPVRLALRTDNPDEIAAKATALSERSDLLFHARLYIGMTTKFLSDVGRELSSPLRAQVKEAILASQQALKGADWNTLRATNNTLSRLYDYRLELVENLLQTIDKVNRLKVSPKLREQFQVAIAPLREAMRGNSWDQIDDQYRQFPNFVHAPWFIVNYIEEGRATIKEDVHPSENKKIQSAIDAVDAALQGDSWQRALTQAYGIQVACRRFDGSPCVRILYIDGGGIRGIIPAMMLAELERRTNTPIAKLFDYVVGTSTGGIFDPRQLDLAGVLPQPRMIDAVQDLGAWSNKT